MLFYPHFLYNVSGANRKALPDISRRPFPGFFGSVQAHWSCKSIRLYLMRLNPTTVRSPDWHASIDSHPRSPTRIHRSILPGAMTSEVLRIVRR